MTFVTVKVMATLRQPNRYEDSRSVAKNFADMLRDDLMHVDGYEDVVVEIIEAECDREEIEE